MAEYGYDEPASLASRKIASGGGQVQRELERQWAAVEEVHGLLGTLEDRLGPVRLAKPEVAEKSTGQPEPIRADLAQGIAGITARIEDGIRRIQTLLSELEL